MSSHRKQRLLRILDIIGSRRVETQEELAAALTEEGFDVTQLSVSRDITALRLIKVDGAYARPPAESLRSVDPNEMRIRDSALSVEDAGDVLVVIRTSPGEANRVAVSIDRLAWPEIVGTIAGDDTIFIAAKDQSKQRKVQTRLRKLIRRT